MTEELFRSDSYLQNCDAVVTGAELRHDGGYGVVLDRTVFYPEGGGQPGDVGTLTLADGTVLSVIDTKKGDAGIVHCLASGVEPPVAGTAVIAAIEWDRRHKLMRMHSALHLLCSVVDGDVTGGQIGPEKSRLDFNLPDTSIDKEALGKALNAIVEADKPMGARWITEDELAAQPDLVRTMSVAPPTGSGRVRLMEIADTDLQPCGGTHVRSTGEIGALRVGKIENKGRQNRRINIHFADS